MAQPIIEVRGLSAGYDGRTVLHDVNLTVYERDFLGIIGPNGGHAPSSLYKPNRSSLSCLYHTPYALIFLNCIYNINE